MRQFLFPLALFLCTLPQAVCQETTAPQPAQAPSSSTPRQEPGVSKKDSESLNAALTEARKASAEKRYADSEALMLKVTQSNPNLILPWVELGLAELSLQKYSDAEIAFKNALGIDPAALKRAHSDDFYQPNEAPGVVAPTATRASRNVAGGGVVNSGENRTPDIKGTSYASLGEIYAHQGKIKEAEDAFDTAVNAFPTQAAQYRHNEMLVFFQTGQSDAQLAAAEKAIGLDSTRASNFYFKAQALIAKATVDPKTQKMVLPPGCAEAYQKYLQLEPNGPYSADAKGVLEGAGISVKAARK